MPPTINIARPLQCILLISISAVTSACSFPVHQECNLDTSGMQTDGRFYENETGEIIPAEAKKGESLNPGHYACRIFRKNSQEKLIKRHSYEEFSIRPRISRWTEDYIRGGIWIEYIQHKDGRCEIIRHKDVDIRFSRVVSKTL